MKVGILRRCLAKSIDLCLFAFVGAILPRPAGIIFGWIYVLAHDGMWEGRSLGKRVFGLQVWGTAEDERGAQSGSGAAGDIEGIPGKPHHLCTLRESVIRNAPLAVATFFAIIPFWGWLILLILGIPLIILEVYLMRTQAGGCRLGDVMADTIVQELPYKPKHTGAAAKQRLTGTVVKRP